MSKIKSKQNKKITKKTVAIVLFGAILLTVVLVQSYLNMIFWNSTQELSAFKMGTLIKTAIDGLDDIKMDVGQDNRIEELKLQLPGLPESVSDLKYLSNEDDTVQISSREITIGNETKLFSQNDIHGLFETAPGIQACSRGFTIKLTEESYTENLALKLSGKKVLSNGRTMYVYRETACDADHGLDELESYLLQADSY